MNNLQELSAIVLSRENHFLCTILVHALSAKDSMSEEDNFDVDHIEQQKAWAGLFAWSCNEKMGKACT